MPPPPHPDAPSSSTQAPCDVAFVLNVLDRCKDPELLLKQVRAA